MFKIITNGDAGVVNAKQKQQDFNTKINMHLTEMVKRKHVYFNPTVYLG